MKSLKFLLPILATSILLSLLGSGGPSQVSHAAKQEILLGTASATVAQVRSSDGLWQELDRKQLPDFEARRQQGPRAYRTLRLNTEAFRAILRRAPKEFTAPSEEERVIVSLPAPDGSFMRFSIEDSPIMDPQLANRYPEIKTYRGQGVDDPTAVVRFDWTQFGFHAIVLSTKGTVLIEPESGINTSDYIAYFQGDTPAGTVECQTEGNPETVALTGTIHQQKTGGIRPAVFSGSSLSTYRLAVAATAEYTQTYGGGTVPGGLAAIATTINLVNAIYERDVAVRLVLVANNDAIVFTDTTTDGYTHDNASLLISENQTRLDAVIGNANYDVGHVFDGRSSGGGFSFQGVATLGSVCRSTVKGRGVSITRSVPPSSVIAYYSTAHEFGHQFGASHTFNATSGACESQRSSTTAYEPGTGSTIMGYRFTCAPEDLMSSDTYFHIASLEQITTYTTTGSGSSCPVSTATGNNIPTVDAGPDYTIPSQTPFALTATASDPDGDELTYCWEQFDLGTPSPPSTDDGTRPIFRSFAPTTNPMRMFPRLTNVLTGLASFGESLPTTTRTMNFRVTVRDNRANGGAANSDGMQLSVTADSGPFRVTQPAADTSWNADSIQTITWDVANTNAPPISCSAVRILLSVDNGITFPIILADATANDGIESVAFPSATGEGRIRIEALGNVFFNISRRFVIFPATSEPSISNISPTTGYPGTNVIITGKNFIGATAVHIGGVSANFTVNSSEQITAVVPQNATSAPIIVQTPFGLAQSSVNFVPLIAFSVFGRVTDGGNNPISGVTVVLDRNFQGVVSRSEATTDVNGNYHTGHLDCFNSVRATPAKVGYAFSPLSASFVSTGCLTGQTMQNFTATAFAGAASIQFSTDHYNVSEAASNIAITLTRTGDTSGTSIIAYATTDADNFTVNCASIAGNAFARCDFATSVDTLTFLPGQTSKSFQIPIINDAYAEGDETFGVTLNNATGATIGTPGTATITITDNETVNGANPIFQSPFFVRQHYLDFLSREPEPDGLNAWLNVLNNCSDVNNDPTCDRLKVSGDFFGSLEFQLKGYFVYRFYKLAFNRLPLYTEIVVDMRAVTGATPTEVFQKKAAFTNNFVLRTEFVNLYNGQTNTQYVNTLMNRYSLASITTPEPAAPDGTTKVTLTTADLINRLNGATLTRAQVLRAIADSDQVFQMEFNRAFVAMQYFGYLRRNPEPAGFNNWLTFLNANPTQHRTMINGFMNSTEYRLRFGPP